MTTYVDYHPSPLHQGSRSRTGDQVDGQLVSDLLRLLGDCRLLWLPNLTDTATSTDRSRFAAPITWSESLASWDTARARLGSGITVTFNGTDEEGDLPDTDRYSFGDGLADSPFSIVALVDTDVADAVGAILSKGGTADEWILRIDATGRPEFLLSDASTGGVIGRQDATALPTSTRVLLVCTYDGSEAESGIRIYLDAARVDDTGTSSGTYIAMENGPSLIGIGKAHTGAGAGTTFWDGGIALAALTAKALTPDEVWALKELVNCYFGLSL